MKCALCNAEITERNSHNGHPLVEGRVCQDCNWKVVRERLRRVNESEKAAKEEIAITGGGGPVNITDPMADFEKYAKQFEETFVLGNTPVRKEQAENKVKVQNGEFTGEVNSMEKEKKAEQVEPEKSATESSKGKKENYWIIETSRGLYKVRGKIALFDTQGDADDFIENNNLKGAVVMFADEDDIRLGYKMNRSSTEALYGWSEIAEFTKLCKEIGIDTLSDLRKFLAENPGDTLEELRRYREEELGGDFKIAAQG